MGGFRSLWSVLRDRNLRWVQLGLAGYSVAESGTWLAILVYAYEQGGVTEAGLAAFVQLVPAAAIAPFTAFLGDRFPRDRVLAAGFAFQTLALGLTATALLTGAPRPLVYAAATLVALGMTCSRPAVGALLPAIARTPAALTAANVAAGFVETVGPMLGPAGAGLILALWNPAAVFVLGAGLTAAATLAASRVRLERIPADDAEAAPSAREMFAGLTILRNQADPRRLIGLMGMISVLGGALDVAFAAVAVELLGRTESAAGLLSSVTGLGAMVGALFAVALVGLRRLTPSIAVGVVVAGVPIMAIAATDVLPLVCALLLLSGAGSSLTDISGRTMLQGLAPDDVLARVFGVLESLKMAGLALGGVAFSGVAGLVGLRTTLVLAGLLLPAAVALQLRRLLAMDAARPEIDPELLAFVRAVPIFAPLPPYSVEQLLVNFGRVDFEPGAVAIHEGAEGHRFYLVARGSATVLLPSGETRNCVPGEYFGEIALLHDIPRTATVAAGPDGLSTWTLDRNVFLEAITGHPRSLGRASAMAGRRLDEQ